MGSVAVQQRILKAGTSYRSLVFAPTWRAICYALLSGDGLVYAKI
jgi:hypothetical protein